MQKKASPNKQQAEFIRRAGLDPIYFTVVKELNHSMIICDRRDKNVQMIDKR